MEIHIIACMSQNFVIGKDGKIPWHISNDFKHFKKLTTGYPVIMGWNTYVSLGKKPLPNRYNIVVTSKDLYAEDVCFVHSLDAAYKAAELQNTDKCFVIGGASIYKQALDKGNVDYIDLTQIDKDFDGDTRFPAVHMGAWKCINCDVITTDETVDFTYRFLTLEHYN